MDEDSQNKFKNGHHMEKEEEGNKGREGIERWRENSKRTYGWIGNNGESALKDSVKRFKRFKLVYR